MGFIRIDPGIPKISLIQAAPSNRELHSPTFASTEKDETIPLEGEISPSDANRILAEGKAVLIDVRTAEELSQSGSVPGSIHIAWQVGPAMTKNPRFLRELSLKVKPDSVVLFICRSGKRSADAALAASNAGYGYSFNVLEGVEGSSDHGVSGWRNRGLPWSPGRSR